MINYSSYISHRVAYNNDQSGATGFSTQYSGHAKADHANTSSFDGASANKKPSALSSKKEIGGQDEGSKRQPTTSAVARAAKPQGK